MGVKVRWLLVLLLLWSAGQVSAQGIVKKHGVMAVPDGKSGTRLVVRKKRITRRVSPMATGYGIAYHGGKVMTGPVKVYYIWYGDWANNTATEILSDLASTVGGADYLGMLAGYSTSAATVSNDVGFGGSVTDNYSLGKVLSDVGVYKVVAAAINSRQLPSDPNGIYFVLSSKDVSESSGFCKSYCAWHTTSGIGTANIRYAFVGNTDRCPSVCAAQTISPNDNPGADGMANNIIHEVIETMTDPDFTGWFDGKGQEPADKCAWNFGTRQKLPNGAWWNVAIGNRKYYLQQNWFNVKKPVAGGVLAGYCGLQ